jgi:hypothetical protein
MKSTKAKTFPETEQGKKPKSIHFRTTVLPVPEEPQQLGVLWSLSGQDRARQEHVVLTCDPCAVAGEVPVGGGDIHGAHQ